MTDLPQNVPQIVIMISSTRADLMPYREEASRVIRKVAGDCERRLQLVEKSMEKEVQRGDRELAVAVSKRWVDESNWVLLIVGWNYGTVAADPAAAGMSVTEWEFRHAVELKKRTFAFVAGDPGTANEYRALEEDGANLQDWKDKQDEEHSAKLTAFKASLASAHLEYFRNLAHFSERLERTLREATDPIRPGTPLADLLIAVGPPIQQCIDKVKAIASCKRVHDQLHELRQNVIRPILESALIQWRRDGQLGVPVATLIANKVGFAEGLVREITDEKQNLGDKGGNLLAALTRVVDMNPKIDFQNELPDLEIFAKTVSRYSAAVQTAFTLADEAMLKDSHALDDLYVSFVTHLAAARNRRRLSPAEEAKLNEGLQRVEKNKQHLIHVLDVHHCWQYQHDKLDRLNGFRRSEDFDEQLANFRLIDSPQLSSLVKDATNELAEGDADAILSGKLDLLGKNLAAIEPSSVLAEFDSLRKTFDDVFYQIDKRTLAAVQASEQRVRDLENRLKELAQQQTETA
ncbi:MAG: DUF4062 domain-containing protein [Casimicrobiaceae bacterium]